MSIPNVKEYRPYEESNLVAYGIWYNNTLSLIEQTIVEFADGLREGESITFRYTESHGKKMWEKHYHKFVHELQIKGWYVQILRGYQNTALLIASVPLQK